MATERVAPEVGRIVLGGLVLLFGFTTLYIAAFHAPRPHDLDVGVVGSAAQATAVQSALDARRPGGLSRPPLRR